MKKTWYLSGPMSNLPDLNFPAFHAAAAELRAAGFDIVNPAEINTDPAAEWAACMRADITHLMTCHGIVILPGWETSNGANLERYIALRLGMPVIPLAEFVREYCREAA